MQALPGRDSYLLSAEPMISNKMWRNDWGKKRKKKGIISFSSFTADFSYKMKFEGNYSLNNHLKWLAWFKRKDREFLNGPSHEPGCFSLAEGNAQPVSSFLLQSPNLASFNIRVTIFADEKNKGNILHFEKQPSFQRDGISSLKEKENLCPDETIIIRPGQYQACRWRTFKHTTLHQIFLRFGCNPWKSCLVVNQQQNLQF